VSATVTRIHPERQPLTRGALLDVDQAELFLLELDARSQGADLPRMAYLLGLAEAHITNLVEIVRAVTR
jgi:hypothetical protein